MTILKNLLYVIFCTLSDLTLCAALLVFLHCFYDAGYAWSKKKACLLFFTSSLLYTLECFSGNISSTIGILLQVLSVITLIVISVFDYKGKFWRGAIRFSLIVFFILICMVCVTSLAEYYFCAGLYTVSADEVQLVIDTSDTLWLLTSLISDIIFIAFFGLIYLYLYIRVYKRGIVMKCGRRERTFAIIFPLFFIILSFLINPVNMDNKSSLIIGGCAILLFGMLIPVFIYYIRISEYYQTRTAYQEDHIKAELAHFRQYRQAQEETAQFRHDIRNNLLCIRDLLNSEKTAEATEYLNDLLDVSDMLRPKFVSGDEMLDCIIASKAAIMAENETPFHLDGVIAGGLPWKPMDVCNVFANAFDNAIDACAQLPKENRYINMTIKATSQYWHIRIENPVKKQVDIERLFQKGGGYTSKPSPNHHGIGTYNMKHTVDLNGGILNAQCDSNTFVLEIAITKSSPA